MIFVIFAAILAFSFFNVRSLCIGWSSTRNGLTGMAAFVVELGNGGIAITVTDRGCSSSVGGSADGLALINSHVSPIFEVDKDVDYPIFPRLRNNSHWNRHRFGWEFLGLSLADDLQRPPLKPSYQNRFRGIEIVLPLFPVVIVLFVWLIAVRHRHRRKIKAISKEKAKSTGTRIPE
jgi:hypothetical protein